MLHFLFNSQPRRFISNYKNVDGEGEEEFDGEMGIGVEY
jgi:hypothetical protein